MSGYSSAVQESVDALQKTSMFYAPSDEDPEKCSLQEDPGIRRDVLLQPNK